jgi:hypothetical protein
MKRTGLFAFALLAACFNPSNPPIGFYCHPGDNPACPDGSECKMVGSDYRCVATGGGAPDLPQAGLIPKTGASYSGPHNDPMLSSVDACSDKELEPNDSPAQAIPTSPSATPTPDTPTPKITHMAICPSGPRPDTGNHDVDYFMVDTTQFSQSSLTIMAEIFYDVTYGDLDVGIFDSTGRLLAADGTAVTNGCVAASIGSGIYYVVVAGANNMDSNRYDIRIRTFSMPHQCPTPGQDAGQ